MTIAKGVYYFLYNFQTSPVYLFINKLGFFLLFFRTIKMSSPMLSNVIILGCILMYSEVFVNAVDNLKPNDYDAGGAICMVRISISYHVAFDLEG